MTKYEMINQKIRRNNGGDDDSWWTDSTVLTK